MGIATDTFAAGCRQTARHRIVIQHAARYLVAALCIAAPGSLFAQGISRAEAVAAALSRGPSLAIARADTMAAAARVIEARGYPDPELIANYSKDAPQYHVLLAWPVDLGGFRSTRIRAAASQREAALLRFQFDQRLPQPPRRGKTLQRRRCHRSRPSAISTWSTRLGWEANSATDPISTTETLRKQPIRELWAEIGLRTQHSDMQSSERSALNWRSMAAVKPGIRGSGVDSYYVA